MPSCKTGLNLFRWNSIELGEGRLLPAVGFEICRVEPAFEIRFACRPLGIEHGEPCGVPIPPFDDHMLPENSFELESEAQRGPA